MAAERILYVCFDPAMLVVRERLLIDEGYDVEVVLGQDGVLSVTQLRQIDFILVGDEGALLERQQAVHRLREAFFPPPIVVLCHPAERIREADYQIVTSNPENWCEDLAKVIRQRRSRLA